MKHVEIVDFPALKYTANESMNTLATNIAFCGSDIKVIEITSRRAGEGKSYISMNLMRTFASLQKRTVLLDCDLRRSHLVSRHKMQFEGEQRLGLAQYLAGMCGIEDIIYETNIPGAWFIPIGRQINASLQLLTKPEFGTLVEYLGEVFDMVLIDCAPAGTVIDAVEVAKHCDGSVLVVSSGVGTKAEIVEMSDSIAKTGCQVLGIVMNQVDMGSLTNRKYYYASHYYGTHYYTKDDKSSAKGKQNQRK